MANSILIHMQPVSRLHDPRLVLILRISQSGRLHSDDSFPFGQQDRDLLSQRCPIPFIQYFLEETEDVYASVHEGTNT